MTLFQGPRSRFGTSHQPTAAERGVPARGVVRSAAPPVPAGEAARPLIWNLEIGGWTEREAGNLVALLNGLRPALSGWNEREIEHLRFLRALVQAGRLDR
jgi:hypothetical protein